MTEQCAMIRGKNDETMRDEWKLEWLNNARWMKLQKLSNAGWMEIRMSKAMRDQWKLEWLKNDAINGN